MKVTESIMNVIIYDYKYPKVGEISTAWNFIHNKIVDIIYPKNTEDLNVLKTSYAFVYIDKCVMAYEDILKAYIKDYPISPISVDITLVDGGDGEVTSHVTDIRKYNMMLDDIPDEELLFEETLYFKQSFDIFEHILKENVLFYRDDIGINLSRSGYYVHVDVDVLKQVKQFVQETPKKSLYLSIDLYRCLKRDVYVLKNINRQVDDFVKRDLPVQLGAFDTEELSEKDYRSIIDSDNRHERENNDSITFTYPRLLYSILSYKLTTWVTVGTEYYDNSKYKIIISPRKPNLERTRYVYVPIFQDIHEQEKLEDIQMYMRPVFEFYERTDMRLDPYTTLMCAKDLKSGERYENIAHLFNYSSYIKQPTYDNVEPENIDIIYLDFDRLVKEDRNYIKSIQSIFTTFPIENLKVDKITEEVHFPDGRIVDTVFVKYTLKQTYTTNTNIRVTNFKKLDAKEEEKVLKRLKKVVDPGEYFECLFFLDVELFGTKCRLLCRHKRTIYSNTRTDTVLYIDTTRNWCLPKHKYLHLFP